MKGRSGGWKDVEGSTEISLNTPPLHHHSTPSPPPQDSRDVRKSAQDYLPINSVKTVRRRRRRRRSFEFLCNLLFLSSFIPIFLSSYFFSSLIPLHFLLNYSFSPLFLIFNFLLYLVSFSSSSIYRKFITK